MAASDLVNLSGLMDDAKCFALVRQHRWPEGARCPGCDSSSVIRDGCDDTRPHRQRYRCKACASRFDDLTGTALAGHHQPLRVWVLCLYFMGLNLSNRQIAGELGLAASDVQAMTEHLRAGLVAKVPAVELKGEVEIDEVYVVAGHKGQPDEVAKRGGSGAAASWQVRRAAARWRRISHRSLAWSSAVARWSCICWPTCSRPRSSRSSRPRSPRALSSTPTNTASTRACQPGLWAQNGLPCPRRIRPRRGRGRVLRGPRQHDGRLLVLAAFLVAPAPGHFAGQAAALSRLLPVRAQRAPARQSPAQRPCCNLGRMTPAYHPGTRQEPRQVSGGTHSDTGRDCRDAFLGLAKTCRKLGIAFWDYLGARLGVAAAPAVPPLSHLIRCRGQPA